MPLPIIPLCWLTFAAFWIFRSRAVKATVERASKSEMLAYRIPTLVGALLIYLSWRLPGPLGLRVNPDSASFLAAADLLCLAGLVGALWSRVALAGNWSNDPTFKKGHELIERGPYHWVRHPIYTAVLLMCLGSALAAGALRQLAGPAGPVGRFPDQAAPGGGDPAAPFSQGLPGLHATGQGARAFRVLRRPPAARTGFGS